MTATVFGVEVTVTSVQLRMLADQLDLGVPGALDRVGALPRQYLAEATMRSTPWEQAARLRGIARFLERWDCGLAFHYPREEWDQA